MSDSQTPNEQAADLKSHGFVEEIHDRDIDLISNHLYLFGREEYVNYETGDEPGVEYLLANRLIRNMNILMRVNPKKPILVHMKTCGGDYQEGMAIHNMIQSCPNYVTILSYTHATSMSSIIFQAADWRVMMPDSYFMIHEGNLAIDGTYKAVSSAMDFEKLSMDRMVEIYAKRMKQRGKFEHRSYKFIRKWLTDIMDKKQDVFFTAKEAVQLGFADAIFDGNWAGLTEK